jgi:cell division protein FtsI/penicillin-binding protein 2
MTDDFRKRIKRVFRFFTARLTLLAAAFTALFFAAAAGALDIVIHAEAYRQDEPSKESKEKIVKTPAPRGRIFDRGGIPLAVNETAYAAKIDPSVRLDDAAGAFLAFARLMNRYGEEMADDLPISRTEPAEFLFGGSEKREAAWKRDMDVAAESTAAEAYNYLLRYFKIQDGLTKTEERQVLALCAARYMERYYYNPITVSAGIKRETIAAIEENKADFPNIYVEKDYLRRYPEGEYVSHVLGYIRKISAEELEELGAFGYTSADIVGKEGIEQAYELELSGNAGETVIHLDSSGRRISSEKISDPTPGSDVFLTIDARLQQYAASALEDKLREILVSKMLGRSPKEAPITAQMVVNGIINTNHIDFDQVLTSEDESLSAPLRGYIDKLELADRADAGYLPALKQLLTQAVNDGKISTNSVIAAMIDQGVVSATETERELAAKGRLSSLTFLINKIEAQEITPKMANLTPSTGSVVVMDVKNGDVLAAANYPNYDNNRFVNNFDNAYFQKLIDDPANPWLNRAFSSPMPPGSTFKMITAVAGLENGVIKPNEQIYDKYTFTEAGEPYAHCNGHHGGVDVARAIMASCNYFFYETSYRLGNTKEGTKLDGIAKLNEYMAAFGLNDPTGVEIAELYTSRGINFPNLSGPERKEVSVMNEADARGVFATASQLRWEDGDTIRTAIGQSFNAYTAANMAKYIATLANGGTRYESRLMKRLVSPGGLVTENAPVAETRVEISEKTLNAVFTGMRLVTTSGTAVSVFKDFPVAVGGKTGTTQQSLTGTPDHASFACFAPFGDPRIAVYVIIPNGNTQTTLSPAASLARDIVGWYFGAGSGGAETGEAAAAAYDNYLSE